MLGMAGQVFITGGSGFVGSRIVEELGARGYSINALSRGKPIAVGGDRVRIIRGDLLDSKLLDEGIAGCDAVIHLVGIIVEKPAHGITFERIHHQGTQQVVDAAKRAGVKRYVHMSALGTRFDAISAYHRTKFLAEEYVRGSGLDWTIFRPSMIHGPRGEFTEMESGWARGTKPPFLFMPYFGAGLFGTRGAGMLQPVYVKDVARAFVDALEKPQTILETYLLGGSEQLTWPQMHQISAQAIRGKKRWIMPLPAWYAKLLTAIVPASLLPFNRDQVIMSQEDNTCDLTKFTQDFGWEPRGFSESLKMYAGQL